MDIEFQYILQPYKGMSSRYLCPSCNKKKQFAKYINTENNQPLADHVGRCNREVNCGYHYTPKQYFEDNPALTSDNKTTSGHTIKKPAEINKPQPDQKKKISLIPYNIFDKTLKAYENNNLVKFLNSRIGIKETERAIQNYYLGTSKHWNGATIFWQIDIKGRVRTGKVMLYNPDTGKRIKEPYPHINWIHKIGKFKDFNLNQCLFGEHLLKLYPDKNIAIVESEKTALIASAHIPENNWLASGNLNNLNKKTLQNLKGKSILLYPDAGAFEIWKEKAEKLKELVEFNISDLIEIKATPEEIKKGYDLADYLTEEPTKFTTADEVEQIEIRPSKNNIPEEAEVKKDQEETAEFFKSLKDSDMESPKTLWPIEELELFFDHTKLPEEPIQLDQATTINHIDKYIQSNLIIVKANNGKRAYWPYYERLLSLKKILESNNKLNQ